MDYELKELLSQINTALDLESECLKAGVELWEIRENVDVELARDKFIVDEPIEFNDRVKFCETVDEFVSTMADMSLSRKVMEVTLFSGSDDAFNVAFLRVLLGPDDNGKTNIDCNLIELLSRAYDNQLNGKQKSMRFFTATFLFLLPFASLAAPSEKLIDALVHVESQGQVHAIGDNGKAVGPLQIHKEVVDDVNKAYGTTYTYADRKSLDKSREICRMYLVLHGGRHATNERYARIWNGGPRGHRKASTSGYWRRVKAIF